MELTKEVLQRRYSTFSDQALLAAKAAGPKPYSPLAWEVIETLVAARGLTNALVVPAPTPQARDESPETADTAAVSPYFLVSRLRGERWPSDEQLPFTARYIIALAALIFGAAGVGVVLAAFTFRGPEAIGAPGVLELAAAAGVSLGFAYSTRRPPTPATWWLATLYCSASAVLAMGQIGTINAPRWPQLGVGAVVGVLWLLYFARRRPTYDLAPWPRLM